MLPEYPQSAFDQQPLSCPHCGWSGTGADTVVIDLYGVSPVREVHCPNCDKKIAAVVKDDRSDPPGESASDLSFQIG